MKKSRHFTLALAILIPTFLALVLGEASIYVGAYFSLRATDISAAIANDKEDITALAKELIGPAETTGNLLGYGLIPIIRVYEEEKANLPYAPGSPEEEKYKAKASSASGSMLYANVEARMERFITTFVGIFYEDVDNGRLVLVCTSDSRDETSRMSNISLYLGSYVKKESYVVEDGFYGESGRDANIGDIFISGTYLGAVKHPTQEMGGPYRLWLVRETAMDDVLQNIPGFSKTFAIVASAVLVTLSLIVYLLLHFIVIRPAKRLASLGNDFSKSLSEGKQRDVFAPSTNRHKNELTDLNDALFTAQAAIGDYAEKLRISTANEARIKADLALAERIQSSMVPHEPLVGKKFVIRGAMKPAKEVGGDLYNYFQVDDDHVAFFIGDVSGKGVGAALFMAKANTVLRLAAADFDFNKANRNLCEGNNENLFVTAFMGILEISTGKLRYVNAGHEPVFIYRNGEYAPLEEDPNFMLGYFDDLSYVIQETTLAPGERLFLYTDGISEAMNEKRELFGKGRILASLNSTKGLPSSESLPLIHRSVDAFVGNAEQSDDACVLALDYGEEAALSFPPNKDGLSQVVGFIDEFLADVDLKTRDLIQVIADEICSNVVYYSQASKPVRLLLRKEKKAIYMTLIDEGIAFNPLEKAPKPEDDDTPGGLGIVMAESLSNEIHYDRIAERNVLRLMKKIG